MVTITIYCYIPFSRGWSHCREGTVHKCCLNYTYGLSNTTYENNSLFLTFICVRMFFVTVRASPWKPQHPNRSPSDLKLKISKVLQALLLKKCNLIQRTVKRNKMHTSCTFIDQDFMSTIKASIITCITNLAIDIQLIGLWLVPSVHLESLTETRV